MKPEEWSGIFGWYSTIFSPEFWRFSRHSCEFHRFPFINLPSELRFCKPYPFRLVDGGAYCYQFYWSGTSSFRKGLFPVSPEMKRSDAFMPAIPQFCRCQTTQPLHRRVHFHQLQGFAGLFDPIGWKRPALLQIIVFADARITGKFLAWIPDNCPHPLLELLWKFPSGCYTEYFMIMKTGSEKFQLWFTGRSLLKPVTPCVLNEKQAVWLQSTVSLTGCSSLVNGGFELWCRCCLLIWTDEILVLAVFV